MGTIRAWAMNSNGKISQTQRNRYREFVRQLNAGLMDHASDALLHKGLTDPTLRDVAETKLGAARRASENGSNQGFSFRHFP